MFNIHEAIGYPLFLVAGLEFLLGFLLLSQNSRNSFVNKSAAAIAFFSSAFALSCGIMYLRASQGLPYNIFARLNWIGWFSIPAALQFLYYLRNENTTARTIGYILYPFWFVIFIVAIFTDLVVTQEYVLIPYSNRPGPLEQPLRLFAAGLIVWVILKIIKLRKQSSGALRRELNFFLTGIAVFGAGAAAVSGVLPVFSRSKLEPGLSAYFSLPWVILTFYAIAKYELFDIRLALSRSISAVLLLSIFSAVQAALFMLIYHSLGNVFAIVVSLAFVGFLFLVTPLSDFVQSTINSIVLKDRILSQEVLRNAASALSTMLRLDDLLDYLLKTLHQTLKAPVALYLKKNGSFELALHIPNADIQSRIELPHVLAGHLLAAQKPVIREIHRSFKSEPDATAIVSAMDTMGAEVLVPVFYQNRLRAALALGQKQNNRQYTQTDLQLLESLANHAAVAIENATLFQDAIRARESLQKSEEKFRTLAETIPAGIFIHHGREFLYGNPAGIALSGYSWDELCTMQFWDLVHPDFRDMVRERSLRRLAGEDTPQQYEIKFITKSGEIRWVLLYASRMEFEGKLCVIGIAIDITDRKELESRLLYMQKMEALGRLAGGIAHDFNNILGAIIGHSNLMQLEIQKENPLHNHIDQILLATERAAGLIQRLLSFGSRKKDTAFSSCDIGEFIAQQKKFLSSVLTDSIQLEISRPLVPLTVMADSAQLERLLTNLVVNARDAMPKGGKIKICVDKANIDQEFINKHGFGRTGSYACLSVHDTGTGMDEATCKKIFEPFFTTKAAGKGTGFGLSIVYDIVKEHKGYIVVSSKLGVGSVFSVYLPLSKSLVLHPMDSPKKGAGRTILLADDDETNRKYVRAVLESEGYTVIEAEDGEDAVNKFQQKPGSIHLVMVDIIMPKMNGRKVFHEVRRSSPSVPFLFTSGYAEDILIENDLLDRSWPFLPKPANKTAIISKVRSVL